MVIKKIVFHGLIYTVCDGSQRTQVNEKPYVSDSQSFFLNPLSVAVRFALSALHLTVGHRDVQRLQAEGSRADGWVHGGGAHCEVSRPVDQGRRVDVCRRRAPSGGSDQV